MNGRIVASQRVHTLADQELELGPRGVAEDVVGLDHREGRADGKAIVSGACWVSRGRWENTGIKGSSAIVRPSVAMAEASPWLPPFRFISSFLQHGWRPGGGFSLGALLGSRGGPGSN